MSETTKDKPNIVFIMSDDHASHALSCYGSKINKTPNLDRIAQQGMQYNQCFCTNSICGPSRATILTGTYNHINGVTTLKTPIDGRQVTLPKILQENGYQTAIFGKWHLGHGGIHDPTGFDAWRVLPGQGKYHNPDFHEPDGKKEYPGYVTDIITDFTIDWLKERNQDQPFMVMCHHKAPHRNWQPDDKHKDMYKDEEIPEPETLFDDYKNRARAAELATMRVDRDLDENDLLQPIPKGMDPVTERKWKYQAYIKNYLRCVASIDDNVGRLLDYLESEGLMENTIVVYTSDQGFFLGDHGWYDKRFMYEESLNMPFMMSYPKAIKPGTQNNDMILNVDFAQTFLDYCGIEAPSHMQGQSFRPLCEGNTPADWRTGMYYRYWMHKAHHNVMAHYGIRTLKHKLIYYYSDPLDVEGAEGTPEPPEWELFDLEKDPLEMNSVYHDPAYADVVAELTEEMHRLQAEVGDERYVEAGA